MNADRTVPFYACEHGVPGGCKRDTKHKNLIPVNGVHITEGKFPQGFYVAQYDAEGFTSSNRWFATIEEAATYAAEVREALSLRNSLSQLIEICRVKCGPNDEPILPGISNHQALVNAVEVLARSQS